MKDAPDILEAKKGHVYKLISYKKYKEELVAKINDLNKVREMPEYMWLVN